MCRGLKSQGIEPKSTLYPSMFLLRRVPKIAGRFFGSLYKGSSM